MNTKYNPNTLKPGDEVNTLSGPAEFVQYKQGNFRNQNYQVKLRHNGQTKWYTEDQLRQANKEKPEAVAMEVPQHSAYDLRAML